MIQKSISLRNFNTFGFDINCSLFCQIQSVDELQSIWKTTLIPHSNPFILGGGSNILFTDNYPGLILKNEIYGREIIKENDDQIWVKFGGGEIWHNCVMWAVENGWGGMENLSLIPGTMGAAPIQNIGAYGVEVEQIFEYLEAFDLLEGKLVKIQHADCNFGYRDSIFKNEAKGRYFICAVVLRLNKNPQINLSYGDIAQTLEQQGVNNPGIADVSRAVIAIRSSKLPDPKEIGNCGSFFKNPVIPLSLFEQIKMQHADIRSFPASEGNVKIPAAWLIEKSGWKGYRAGDAGVHTRQALVLVNYGNAKGSEIRNLAFAIQKDVFEKFGVLLEMEVNMR